MPTTATVSSGLRELASFLDTNPDVVALRRSPEVSLHLSYILVDAETVDSVARRLNSEVKTTTVGETTHTTTIADFGGVEVSFFALNDSARVLRRDPEATVALAERDA